MESRLIRNTVRPANVRTVVLMAAFLAGCGGAGAASATTPPSELSKLKWRAMQRLAPALDARLEREYPVHKRVTFYVDVQVPHYRLQHATLWLDGERLAERTYARDSARALHGRAVHRLARATIPPGRHHLRMTFTGERLAGAFAGASERVEIRISFKKGDTRMALILPVSPDGVSPSGPWRVRSWQWQGTSADARLGMVRFLRATGRRFDALYRLLTIRAARPAEVPDGFHVLMAHSFIDLGMPFYARRALTRADPATIGRQARNEAFLRLARLQYRRSRNGAALDTLAAVAQRLTPPQDLRRRDLRARVLLAMDKPEAALATLRGTDAPLPLHMRFNRAVALAASGRGRAANALFNEIGLGKPGVGIDPAIRDRANLIVGYHHSRARRPVAARLALVRVRPEGPYADEALLRLAWIAALQAPGFDGPRVRYAGLEFGPWPDGPGGLHQAFAAWTQLAQGNPAAAVTQEALAARAVLAARTSVSNNASQIVWSAIHTLEATRSALMNMVVGLRTGHFPRTVTHGDFHGIPNTDAMACLRAGYAFQSIRGHYNDLVRLRQALAKLGQGGSVLTRELNKAAAGLVDRGQAMLAAGLKARRMQLDRYLTAVRIVLAHMQRGGS